MKRCPHCGAELEEQARFCTCCMTSLADKQFIANPMRVSTRLLTLLTALFLALVFSLSVCAFMFIPPQDQPSDSAIERPSRTESSSSQAVIFSQDNSSSSSARESQSSDPFFDFFSLFNGSSSSESFSVSDSGRSSSSSRSSLASSSASSSTSSSSQSSSKSSSSVSDNWGSNFLSFSAPVGFESCTVALQKTGHWLNNYSYYSYPANYPEVVESMGINSDRSVFVVGFKPPPTGTRYYIPESINNHTVVGITHDQGLAGIDFSTFYSHQVSVFMKELYCPPSCRFFSNLTNCNKLTDIYIAADSFYMSPNELPPLEDYYAGYSPYDPRYDHTLRPITIHAKPDAWCEYAGMTISEYLSQPGIGYRCSFEPWDPSTVY